jgi:hypothetical protein
MRCISRTIVVALRCHNQYAATGIPDDAVTRIGASHNRRTTAAMQLTSLLAFLAFSLFMISSAADAGEGEFRCPTPGTQIATSVRGHLTSEGAEGFNCRMRTSSRLVAPHAVFADSDASPAWREAAEKLWPLEVGKQSEYSTVCDGSSCYHGLSYTIKFTVIGIEDITVKAGIFRAFRVTVVNTSDHPMAKIEEYKSQRTYWWAPTLGYTVKYDRRLLSGFAYNESANWEVTSVVAGPLVAK